MCRNFPVTSFLLIRCHFLFWWCQILEDREQVAVRNNTTVLLFWVLVGDETILTARRSEDLHALSEMYLHELVARLLMSSFTCHRSSIWSLPKITNLITRLMSNSELDSWWRSGLRRQFSQERKKAAVGLTSLCVSVTLLLCSILKHLALNLSSPSCILLSVTHSPPRLHNFILCFFLFLLTFCCLLRISFLPTSLVEVIKSTCPDVMTLDCIVYLIGIYFTTYLTCLTHLKHNPAALALKLLITLVDPLSGSERRGGATESLSFPSGCLTLWHIPNISTPFSHKSRMVVDY